MITNANALALPYADDSLDAALCSPPYWGGLRVYEGEQGTAWPAVSYAPMVGLPPVAIPEQAVALGHEPDPFAFVGHLLLIFREVRRVLRPDACLAVNLGDCYSSGAYYANGLGKTGLTGGSHKGPEVGQSRPPLDSMPSKNLLLMPHRFALAMQADGWVLRSRMPGGVEVFPEDDVGIEPDIVWRKKACMPESVRDRPTVDFEDVYIFAQGPRYFWDMEAGREENGPRTVDQGDYKRGYTAGGSVTHGTGAATLRNINPAGRNMRSVWTINPEPTSAEHFAAWPTKLAARLIRVMTSERGVCPTCGAPWIRQVERRSGAAYYAARRAAGEGGRHGSSEAGLKDRGKIGGNMLAKFRRDFPDVETGWAPSCDHGAEPVKARVLDPFAGLGRTWEAAILTGRRFVGAELALPYCRFAVTRNDAEAMAAKIRAGQGKTITGPLFADRPTKPALGVLQEREGNLQGERDA